MALIVAAMAVVTWVEIQMCPMARVLRVPCPGCGMTRATLAALRGDWSESFRFHPLATVLVPMFLVYALAHSVSYIRHGVSRVDEVLTGKWINRGLLALLVLMLSVWVARFFGVLGGPAPV